MKILIANITDSGILRNRSELIEQLISQGHSVTVVAPRSKAAERIKDLGCSFIDVAVEQHGMNPIKEFSLLLLYRKILKKEKPDVVLTFTIKPNLYFGLICRQMKIPHIMNVTGLGEALMHDGIAKWILLKLYPVATKNVKCIFFQNEFNRQFFIDNKLANPNIFKLIPGSGINLAKYKPMDYPDESDGIRFLFVGRIIKDKGIDELIDAIKIIRKKYFNVEFHLVGGCSKEYQSRLNIWETEGLIIKHGRVEDMKSLYREMHCLIHPSYHEGMANVVLESAACARPCIVSNINGCKEAVDDDITGYLVDVKNADALAQGIEKFLSITHKEKKKMGLAGRMKMEREFDRQIVVNAYLKGIKYAH